MKEFDYKLCRELKKIYLENYTDDIYDLGDSGDMPKDPSKLGGMSRPNDNFDPEIMKKQRSIEHEKNKSDLQVVEKELNILRKELDTSLSVNDVEEQMILKREIYETLNKKLILLKRIIGVTYKSGLTDKIAKLEQEIQKTEQEINDIKNIL
jgi:hypothetical protein